MSSTIGDRIKQRRLELGLSQRKLADMIGIKPPSLYGLESGKAKSPSAMTLQRLVKALHTTADWLLEGKGPKDAQEAQMNVREAFKTGHLQPTVVRQMEEMFPVIRLQQVPVLSFVQAGNWHEIMLNQPDDIEYLPCPVSCGPKTFALTVQGESMLPRFNPGDYIFIDPEKGHKSGDFVVVQIDDENTATFKQYLETEDGPMLKALNPEWPNRYIPLSDKHRIIGRVIAKLEAL